MKPVVLIIAGFDPSGGAGVLRDVRAVEAIGGSARVAVTALTAQNEHHFHGFEAVGSRMVEAQILSAIEVGAPSAVKVGMLGSEDNCDTVGRIIQALRPAPPVIVDPVLAASTGGILTDDTGLDAVRRRLLPFADLVTPNVPEAAVLTGMPIEDRESMEAAARSLLRTGAKAVLLKGGHLETDPVVDILALPGRKSVVLEHEHIPGSIHGSGCLLSSTVAAHLAFGKELLEAVNLGVDAVLDRIKRSAPPQPAECE